jgi:hypothetical protein
MASQSILFQFISLSVLPEKIVGELFKEQATVPLQKNSKQPQRTDNSANTSSDFSIVTFDKKIISSRLEIQRTGEFDSQGYIGICRQNSLSVEKVPKGISFDYCFIFLIMGMIFFLLPRSSVGDYALRMTFKGISPNLAVQVGFFLCLNNLLCGSVL